MPGLARVHASHLLEHGWSKPTILALHQKLQNVVVEDFVSYWGLKLSNGLLIYRNYTPEDVDRAFAMPRQDGEVLAFADGSGTTHDKPAGIGVVVYRDAYRPQLIAENIGPGTNNRAELAAIWRALQAVPDTGQAIMIRSDSEYAMGSVSRDWIPKKNTALIEAIRLDLSLRPGKVSFKHVNGHVGVAGNEIADSLAGVGRKYITTVTQFEE